MELSTLLLFSAAVFFLNSGASVNGNVIRVHRSAFIDKEGKCKLREEISEDRDLVVETYNYPCDEATEREARREAAAEKSTLSGATKSTGDFFSHDPVKKTAEDEDEESEKKKKPKHASKVKAIKPLKKYCKEIPEYCLLYYLTKELTDFGNN